MNAHYLQTTLRPPHTVTVDKRHVQRLGGKLQTSNPILMMGNLAALGATMA